ncbi:MULTISPECIES: CbtB domain-containing protein [Rhizobium]|jgi:cobalt transporter subunit CbtB|uniref:CbtB domain-containing protein n=1 Tax=Rhizobium TaxID=379 RepID=UPI00027D7C76|nr:MULTISPECIES: CbtB-domain containing protein [Rhizobium]EJC71173.1 cobalt transporter subunit CbtB [Rhizobium leguminosarum bv. viciae WSM1455]MBY5325523.1 CbtB-domain containing protein [Rhizobium leguminosarum]MBY5381398.1 CbtB-domain containing protein [Rhizobium leguminosarum]MCA2432770.1 CbtB-domain containing protein [Rhizobium leguminosarum]MCW1411817.1 CbtB-domain containing protein [Rhizobium acaciae]
MSISASTAIAAPNLTASAAKILQAATAVFFGLLIVGFVGFSHIEIVHNAAHDTRHANAFPCH